MPADKPRAVEFFGAQFERQIAAHDYKLNPFEERALPYLSGNVLDLGCGLGNLALAAAARGAHVTAYDACENAVEDLAERAIASGLDVWVKAVDLKGWRPEETYDAVELHRAPHVLRARGRAGGPAAVRDAVRPGGVAVVNAMIEGIDLPRDVRPRGVLPLRAGRDSPRPSPAGRCCTTASRSSPRPATR